VAKRTDVRNLFRKASSKNSSPDLLIAGTPIVEGVERSGGQLHWTTKFGYFQITNVHPTDGYGLLADWEAAVWHVNLFDIVRRSHSLPISVTAGFPQ
jgi:hypothetical protein